MTLCSSGTDDEIWWRKIPCIEKWEKFLFVQVADIVSLENIAFHSTDNLILTTIGDREDHSHALVVSGRIHSIEETRTDIEWEEPEISYSSESYLFLMSE